MGGIPYACVQRVNDRIANSHRPGLKHLRVGAQHAAPQLARASAFTALPPESYRDRCRPPIPTNSGVASGSTATTSVATYPSESCVDVTGVS
jgi:hypothetical protein